MCGARMRARIRTHAYARTHARTHTHTHARTRQHTHYTRTRAYTPCPLQTWVKHPIWPDSSYLQLPHSPGPHASSTAWVLGEQYLPFSNVETGASHVSAYTHTKREDADGRRRNVRFSGTVRRPMTANLRRACRLQGSESRPLTPEMRPSQSSPSSTSSGTVKFSPSRILLRGPNTSDTCMSYIVVSVRHPGPLLPHCIPACWRPGHLVNTRHWLAPIAQDSAPGGPTGEPESARKDVLDPRPTACHT